MNQNILIDLICFFPVYLFVEVFDILAFYPDSGWEKYSKLWKFLWDLTAISYPALTVVFL